MNTSQAKLLAWATAGTVGALMGGYVFLFFQNVQDLQGAVPAEQVTSTLKVEAQQEATTDKVAYDLIRKGLIDLNWTGKLPEVVVVNDGPKTAPKVESSGQPIKDLVRVVMVAGDTVVEGSFCVVQYLSASKVTLENAFQGVLYVGDKLKSPLDYITVKSISGEGVMFSFNDETREPEMLLPPAFEMESGIVALDPEQEQIRRTSADASRRIVRRTSQASKKTYQIKPGVYRLGTEDTDYFGENYQEVLTRDVRTTKHRNPVTGSYDGIAISQVAKGSAIAAHGVEEGDVIKSINGHPVTTPAEAIQYVKNNSDKYDEWVVVISNKGLERSVTYKSPDK